MKRVVMTGMGGVSALGNRWDDIEAALKRGRIAVRRAPDWDDFQSLHTRLACPLPAFVTPEHYPQNVMVPRVGAQEPDSKSRFVHERHAG